MKSNIKQKFAPKPTIIEGGLENFVVFGSDGNFSHLSDVRMG